MRQSDLYCGGTRVFAQWGRSADAFRLRKKALAQTKIHASNVSSIRGAPAMASQPSVIMV